MSIERQIRNNMAKHFQMWHNFYATPFDWIKIKSIKLDSLKN